MCENPDDPAYKDLVSPVPHPTVTKPAAVDIPGYEPPNSARESACEEAINTFPDTGTTVESFDRASRLVAKALSNA